MAIPPDYLKPTIKALLSSADLATVTTRQIRKELVKQTPSLEAYVTENKAAIDAITKTLFEELNNPPSSPSRSRSPEPAPKKKLKKPKSDLDDISKKKKKAPKTDEEVARDLAKSLNSEDRPSRRSSSSAVGSRVKKVKKEKKSSAASSPAGRGKKVKSSAYMNSDGEPISDAGSEEDDSDQGTTTKKRKRSGGGGGAFNAPMTLSPELQDLVDGNELSRPQCVKRIWAYVKERGLQDESDRRYILCDDKLRAVFDTKRVHMFTLNKILSNHIKKSDE